MNKEEAKTRYPEMVELLKDRMNVIEKAESYEDFSKRIIVTFNKIVASSRRETIGIVSHGGPMRVLFRDILKWGELKEIGDCSFIELDKTGDEFFWAEAEGLVPDFEISRNK
jgi:broad specificity phosphatase PhoE